MRIHSSLQAPTATTRWPMVKFAGLFLCFIMGLSSSACVKQCKEASHCQKICECTDTQRNQIIDCPFMFTCDIATETCEAAFYEWTCDEVCEKAAARGLCGSKRCESELDCNIDTACDCRDPVSGAIVDTFGCEKDIACDTDINVCGADFALPQQQQCEICAAEQGACGGI